MGQLSRLGRLLGEIMNERPAPPEWKGEWYSICSIHREFNAACEMCNTGRWVNDELHELERWLYEHNADLWREWANRPESESRKFLEETFPNLRVGKAARPERRFRCLNCERIVVNGQKCICGSTQMEKLTTATAAPLTELRDD